MVDERKFLCIKLPQLIQKEHVTEWNVTVLQAVMNLGTECWWLLTSCRRPRDMVCPLVAEHNTTWEMVLPKPSNVILIKLLDPTVIYRKHQGWRKMLMVITRTWPSKSRVWDIPEDKWPGSFHNNLPGWELMTEGKLIRLRRYSNQMK